MYAIVHIVTIDTYNAFEYNFRKCIKNQVIIFTQYTAYIYIYIYVCYIWLAIKKKRLNAIRLQIQLNLLQEQMMTPHIIT